MAVCGNGLAGGNLWNRLRIILDMIKFEHTIFALPFALISAILASRSLPHGLPSPRIAAWIVAAMIGARSAAMAFNRLVDARIDAQNSRTATRALPAGLLRADQVAVFTVASVALFELAAYELNTLCFFLSPIALAAILGYSYTKRFTALCHLVLGFAIGIAPVGAWVAVTGRVEPVPLLLGVVVMLWIGGFDIIYALQDVDFDRRMGLFSMPRLVGKGPALLVSRLLHTVMIATLVAIGMLMGLHAVYFLGVAVVGALIAYEQSIVSPHDLSRVNVAFFTLNGWVSVSLLAFVALDRIVAH